MNVTALGESSPNLDGFIEQARTQRVIPVTRSFLADGLTPVGMYQALCGARAGTFLFESAEPGKSWSRYSFIGVRSVAMLSSDNGQARWSGRVPVGLPTSGRAVDVLRDSLEALHTPARADLPPFTGGFVGYLAYDAVRNWEKVPDTNPSDYGAPDVCYLLATDMAVLDHWNGVVTLIANAVNFDATDARVEAAWADACRRLDEMQNSLAESHAAPVATFQLTESAEVVANTSHEEFKANVERVKEYIRSGDAFQVVLSQRFEFPFTADALNIYRVLRSTNPSPYMYLLRMPIASKSSLVSEETAICMVGSSPEALVTVRDRHCTVHPIAGTRPRGDSAAQDAALSAELFADTKERAEHLMLVDLARNDLGKVCAPGTVDVVEFMQVERYSHVMHLVSTVTGELAPDHSAFDALAATFPAGTLSGAPKPRAMAIIDELEPVRRSVYGGAVGYLDFAGNLDVAIAIRTGVVVDGKVYVQAGAGIVADSDPDAEDQECWNKAAAVLRAAATAKSLANARRVNEVT